LRDEEKETLEWEGVVRRRWKGNRRRGTVKVKVKFRLNVKSRLKYCFNFLIFLLNDILVNVLLVWGWKKKSWRCRKKLSCISALLMRP